MIISHSVISGTQLFSDKYKVSVAKIKGMEAIHFGHDGFRFVDVGLPRWEYRYFEG